MHWIVSHMWTSGIAITTHELVKMQIHAFIDEQKSQKD